MAADSLTKGLGASRLPKIMEDLCPHRRLNLHHIHCLVSARFQTISMYICVLPHVEQQFHLSM